MMVRMKENYIKLKIIKTFTVPLWTLNFISSNLVHLCNQHFDLQKVYNVLYHCEGIRKEKSISSNLLIPSQTGPTDVLPDPTGRLLALVSELSGERPKPLEYHSSNPNILIV
jgi:hypothetical protein